MKKIVILLTALFCLFCSDAFSAYDNTATCTPYTVDNEIVTYTCAFTDSVAGSATEEFRINADDKAGRIIGIRWESASEDCDIWGSESVDALATDADTLFHFTEINLGYSPELSSPIIYYNTLGEAYLYITVKNDGAIATGTSAILKVIYERY